MKRGKTITATPEHEDKVMSPERDSCDCCGEKAVVYECHHCRHPVRAFRQTRYNKSYRAVKVCGPVTQKGTCHWKFHHDRETKERGPEILVEVLREIVGEGGLDEALEAAGYDPS